jgi:hypothetical protein
MRMNGIICKDMFLNQTYVFLTEVKATLFKFVACRYSLHLGTFLGNSFISVDIVGSSLHLIAFHCISVQFILFSDH